MQIQSAGITPPNANDQSLNDFASVVQHSFSELYNSSHIHDVLSDEPSSQDGSDGDVNVLVDSSGIPHIYFKVNGQWAKIVGSFI